MRVDYIRIGAMEGEHGLTCEQCAKCRPKIKRCAGMYFPGYLCDDKNDFVNPSRPACVFFKPKQGKEEAR